MKNLKEDWVEVELGEVCEKAEKVRRTEMSLKSNFRYFDIGGIDNIRNRIVGYKEYTWKDAPSRAQQIIKKGDVLFSTVRTYLKNIALVDKDEYNNEICSSGFTVLRGKKGLMDSALLFHYSLSLGFLNPLSKLQTGTSYPAVRDKDVLSQVISIPPLPIQRAIVTKIENLFVSLDKGIADLEKAQQQLKVYRQAVLEQGLTGKFTAQFRKDNPQLESSELLFQKIQEKLDEAFKIACAAAETDGIRKPKDHRKNKKANNVTSSLPKIPHNWNYYRLEDITYLVTDGTHFTPKYKEEGVKFLSVKNVRPFFMREEHVKYISQEEHEQLIKRCKPENGDILYTKVGATYGYACKVDLAYEFSIFVSLCLIKPVYEFLLSDFLEILMNSELVFRQARQRVSGSGVPDLHLVEIRDFKVPLPPLEEQHQIVREIESRLSVCDKVEQSIAESLEKSKALRQSILKKAFEGKLLSEAEIAQCKQAVDYEPAAKLLERIKQNKK